MSRNSQAFSIFRKTSFTFVVVFFFSFLVWTVSSPNNWHWLKKNIVWKQCGEKEKNAGNQHFLHFPTMFPSLQPKIVFFDRHLLCRLQMLSIWTSRKYFCRLVKYCKLQNHLSLYIRFVLTCYHAMPNFDALKIYNCGKNIGRKRRNRL